MAERVFALRDGLEVKTTEDLGLLAHGGTGICGLSLAVLGAKEVVLTDRKPLIPLMTSNTQRNHVDDRVQILSFEWGSDASALQPPFDIVLVADCLYYVESHPLLVKSLLDLTTATSTVLISHELRKAEELNFYKMLMQHFTVEQVPPGKLHPDWQDPQIRIFSCRKRG
eukprot:tig00021432_g21230.t1